MVESMSAGTSRAKASPSSGAILRTHNYIESMVNKIRKDATQDTNSQMVIYTNNNNSEKGSATFNALSFAAMASSNPARSCDKFMSERQPFDLFNGSNVSIYKHHSRSHDIDPMVDYDFNLITSLINDKVRLTSLSLSLSIDRIRCFHLFFILLTKDLSAAQREELCAVSIARQGAQAYQVRHQDIRRTRRVHTRRVAGPNGVHTYTHQELDRIGARATRFQQNIQPRLRPHGQQATVRLLSRQEHHSFHKRRELSAPAQQYSVQQELDDACGRRGHDTRSVRLPGGVRHARHDQKRNRSHHTLFSVFSRYE